MTQAPEFGPRRSSPSFWLSVPPLFTGGAHGALRSLRAYTRRQQRGGWHACYLLLAEGGERYRLLPLSVRSLGVRDFPLPKLPESLMAVR